MNDSSPKKDRREFLKNATLFGLGSIILSRASKAEALTDLYAEARAKIRADTYDVIVIGAGMSGLAAAKTMQASGLSVLVLEGRDRIGGRTWTNKIGAGISVDLGASWIHGIKGNPIYELCRKAKIKTAVTNYDSGELYASDGSEIASTASIEARYEQIIRLQSNRRDARDENDEPDIALGDDLDAIIESLGLSAEELQQQTYSINTSIEHEYAADVSDMSALNWDEGGEFKGNDVVFPGGYKQVVALLSKRLKIKLGHIVSKIDYQGDNVIVSTNQGDFTAPQVLVTLPIGVLRKGVVSFSPELPSNKQNAINLLGAGLLNKTYLLFPRTFWPTNVHLLDYISPQKGHWEEWLNMYKYLKKPLLLGFNAATYAHELELLDDTATVSAAMDTLRTIYGSSIPDPIEYLITRWSLDPFSYGSYSYLRVGAGPSTYDQLAAPIDDKLFFAGEATNKTYAATVHGAYLSGLREAARIVKSQRSALRR